MDDLHIKRGFTLVEMMIVISIIGILVTLSIFALNGVRTGARDATRKSNLETIRTALEIYRADCGKYPPQPLPTAGAALAGDSSSRGCSSSNIYLTAMPQDPRPTQYQYVYVRSANTTYTLCTFLEQGSSSPATDCSSQNCGVGRNVVCNYQVKNP